MGAVRDKIKIYGEYGTIINEALMLDTSISVGKYFNQSWVLGKFTWQEGMGWIEIGTGWKKGEPIKKIINVK